MPQHLKNTWKKQAVLSGVADRSHREHSAASENGKMLGCYRVVRSRSAISQSCCAFLCSVDGTECCCVLTCDATVRRLSRLMWWMTKGCLLALHRCRRTDHPYRQTTYRPLT